MYEKQCIFCEKKEKFVKGSKSREGLTQARQLRVDDTVRKAAEIKHDKRILALASRELVAAEAHWHHSCYKNYTRTNSKSVNTTDTEELPESYTEAEFNAFSRLCDYIRNELFQSNNIIELAQLSDMLRGWMLESGVIEIKPSTITHLRRKFSVEFGDSLHLIQNESNKVIVYPDSLTRDQLVLSNHRLQKEVNVLRASRSHIGESLKDVASEIMQSVKQHCAKQEWPPDPSNITQENRDAPTLVTTFLRYVLGGDDQELGECMSWLSSPVGQDLMFGITRGRYKPAKHILLPSAVKSLTGISLL